MVTSSLQRESAGRHYPTDDARPRYAASVHVPDRRDRCRGHDASLIVGSTLQLVGPAERYTHNVDRARAVGENRFRGPRLLTSAAEHQGRDYSEVTSSRRPPVST
jgi:hypothetical protein